MRPIRFDGRVLFLSADAGVVRRQLQGENLDRASAGMLRDDVSTDEITPLPSLVHFDDEIGRHAHTDFRAGEDNPIPLDALRLGGFGVLVAGRRYGKGSSREHAPLAERATLTNMTAELGGFSGIVAPDAETVRFIRERRGSDVVIEDWMASDPGAPYAASLTLDCTTLAPMLAAPGDPGNGIACDELAAPVPIGIAYAGSGTAGKREDFDQYHESWPGRRRVA